MMAVIEGAGLRKPKVPGAAALKRPLLAPSDVSDSTPRTSKPKRSAPRSSTASKPRGSNPGRRSTRPAPPSQRTNEAVPAPRRRGNAQTMLTLPSRAWDEIDRRATEAGTRPGALLAELVRQRGPETPGEAGRLLSGLLATDPVAGNKEDRNIRLPVAVREQLDADRVALRDAGLHEATRSALLLSLWVARGPRSAQDARDLLNAGRLAAIERLP